MFKFGIIGTGDIVTRFCNGLKGVPDAVPFAVGSRHQETAEAFGDKFDIARRYDSYEKLVSDPEVDCVYIGVPHPFHREVACLALAHHKPVLLEKPFTVNAKEAYEIVKAARDHDTFLMEAYWPRFSPVNMEVKRLICEENLLGKIRSMNVRAYMGHEGRPKGHRLYDPKMAGGIFLDIGIYPLSYTTYFLGVEPCEVISSAHITEGGWDDQNAVVFKYPDGAFSVQTSAFQTNPTWHAQIFCENGWADIPSFSNPKRATLYPEGSSPIEVCVPNLSNGYEFEAMHVMDCLARGLKESPMMTLKDSVRQIEWMDACRAQWGLKYPFE